MLFTEVPEQKGTKFDNKLTGTESRQVKAKTKQGQFQGKKHEWTRGDYFFNGKSYYSKKLVQSWIFTYGKTVLKQILFADKRICKVREST